MEGKEPRIAKTLLKEGTVEDMANIKIYKVIITPFCGTAPWKDQLNRKESSETDLFIFINLIFIIFIFCKYEYLLMNEIKCEII